MVLANGGRSRYQHGRSRRGRSRAPTATFAWGRSPHPPERAAHWSKARRGTHELSVLRPAQRRAAASRSRRRRSRRQARTLRSRLRAAWRRRFERAAVPLEHANDTGVGPRGHLRALLGARRRACARGLTRNAFVVCRCACAPTRASRRCVAEEALRSPFQRARERRDEGLEKVGAQRAVERERVAPLPQ